MRYILALIIAVPLLAVSLEADAGLVEDLRNGKSNVRASSHQSSSIDAYRLQRLQKSAPDYKAIITSGGWVYRFSGHSSAEQAVEGGLSYCKEHSRQDCRVFAVGDNIVQNDTQEELADAIEAYQLEVSGSKSTSSAGKTVYCKSKDGSVYTWDSYLGGLCGELTEITKAEYDRLNNKKTVTARKSTTSSRSRQAYCKRDDGSVVAVNRLNLDIPCGPHTEISNAEYDRLKDKKTDTASTTKPDTSSSVDDPLEAKLEKLKKLLEQGLITEEEAAEKRAKLLEDL